MTDHAVVVELFNPKHLTGKLARWSLIVQNFQPTFSFLPGKANVVTDSLSRYIGTLQISGWEELKSELSQTQRKDKFCTPLIYYLESSDETHLLHIPVPLPEFDLHDDTRLTDTFTVTTWTRQRGDTNSRSTKQNSTNSRNFECNATCRTPR